MRSGCKNQLLNNYAMVLIATLGYYWCFFVLLFGLVTLSGCGNSSSAPSADSPVSGNWQFTKMDPPVDNSVQGGFHGGFLLQTANGLKGQFTYSFSLPSHPGTFCNSGVAAVTGTLTGQNATLTAIAGPQTYTLSGSLSADGSTLMGTYNSTDGQGCGTAQNGLLWAARLLPSLSGAVQGSFHSTGGSNGTLRNQDFLITGSLMQGPNIGASSATITGTLDFQGYPCLRSASVNGQISGSQVILQLIGTNGLNVGQIGSPPTLPNQVSFNTSSGSNSLRGAPGYQVTTSSCPGGNTPGDVGNVCLALGTLTQPANGLSQFSNLACNQPVTLTPASISFPIQPLSSTPTTQSFTLTNTDPSNAAVNGLRISFSALSGSFSFHGSDFDGIPNFSETDNCANPQGSSFSLGPQQSCTITITFAPQQSCTWIPTIISPSHCPPFLTSSVPTPPALAAQLTVSAPSSADGNPIFEASVSGIGLSAIQPSTPEIDFGSEVLNGAGSAAQSVTFTNQGFSPIQILPPVNTACGPPAVPVTLPRPLVPGTVPGIRAVTQIGVSESNNTSIQYVCDIDPTTGNPAFPIVGDTCSGTLLAPSQSCTVSLKFVPQPLTTVLSSTFDFFLELNTLQCSSTNDCEIDAGRFPVEIKANPPSPLTMTPGAGLDFGIQAKGQTSLTPLKVTLFNDPEYPDANNPKPQVVNFSGIVVKGDFSEVDDCFGKSLSPGSSCALSVSFTPQIIGFDQGTITVALTNGLVQTIYLRGFGQ
jgi:hypothetical protein